MTAVGDIFHFHRTDCFPLASLAVRGANGMKCKIYCMCVLAYSIAHILRWYELRSSGQHEKVTTGAIQVRNEERKTVSISDLRCGCVSIPFSDVFPGFQGREVAWDMCVRLASMYDRVDKPLTSRRLVGGTVTCHPLLRTLTCCLFCETLTSSGLSSQETPDLEHLPTAVLMCSFLFRLP